MRFRPVESRKLISGHIMWFGLWLGVTLVSLYLRPSPAGHATHTQLGLAPCPSAFFLHRPCPGCGLTTSFSATVHGDWPLAFSSHPFGPAWYVFFTLSAFACLYGWLTRKRFDTETKGFNWALGAFTLVYLAYSVYRFAAVSDYTGFGRMAQTRTAPMKVGAVR